MKLTLIHPGGESKEVETESISHTYVSIRWGQSGLYNIMLKTNEMVACNLKVRRRAQCLWKVVDIEKLRSEVKTHFDGAKSAQLDISFNVHNNSMPGVK